MGPVLAADPEITVEGRTLVAPGLGSFTFLASIFSEPVLATFRPAAPFADRLTLPLFFELEMVPPSIDAGFPPGDAETFAATIHYDESDLSVDVSEDQLSLYHRGVWIRAAFQVDGADNTLTARLERYYLSLSSTTGSTDQQYKVVSSFVTAVLPQTARPHVYLGNGQYRRPSA